MKQASIQSAYFPSYTTPNSWYELARYRKMISPVRYRVTLCRDTSKIDFYYNTTSNFSFFQ